MQLLAKGASLLVCSPVRDGGTPMHEAAATSANEAALELLRHGASPFVVNRHSTPHLLAISARPHCFVRRLIAGVRACRRDSVRDRNAPRQQAAAAPH